MDIMGSFIDWFGRSYKGVIIGLVAFGAIMMVVLALQHVNESRPAAGAEPGPIPTFSSTPETSKTFAVVGDSVTAANSPDIDNGKPGDGSWTFYASRDGARLVGGWALGGATTAAMNSNVHAYDADVLVILAGTNDTGQSVPFSTTESNLKSIVDKSGISKVIVSSIPPRDEQPKLPSTYNEQLQALALDQGWTYVDASATLSSDGHYKAGYTADGIHPTVEGAKQLGSALHAAIVAS